MDPTSTVKTDALPAIATVMVPGAVASTPYVWIVLDGNFALRAFLETHEALSGLLGFVLSVAIGFAIDSLGSYVEVYWIDRRRSDHDQMLRTWWLYLRIAWQKEPVGQNYLRKLLVTFKSELNMFVATGIALPGFAVLGFVMGLGAG